MKKLLLVSFNLILAVCIIQTTGEPKTPSGTSGTGSANPKIAAAYQGTKQVAVYATLKDYEEAKGISITKFGEAPSLAAKVSAGEIPSVEERLPEEPLVVLPADKIGSYGGNLVNPHMGNIDFLEDMLREFPLMFTNDLKRIVPNLIKDWVVNPSATEYTFHIRKGIKWSDGVAFTSDAFLFWYQAYAMNMELNPHGISHFKDGNNKMGIMTKIDDYSFKVGFSTPNGIILEKMCRFRPVPYLPGHYLKQFHPLYSDPAQVEKLVKDEGFSSWVELFNNKRYYFDNPDSPTIFAWMPTNKANAQVHVLERNPYFWAIDAAGNQLPYADGVHRVNLGNQETIVLKALAGDVDYVHPYVLGYDKNYPLFKREEARGKYRIITQGGWSTFLGSLMFNMNSPDTLLKRLFNQKDFRIALSVGMDRNAMNEVVFKGQYTPSQAGPPVGPPYYGESGKFKQYTEYDMDMANSILDKLGLKWNDGKTTRLRPDTGAPLEIVAIVNTDWTQTIQICEIMKDNFQKLGINLILKPLAQQFFGEKRDARDYQIAITTIGFGGSKMDFASLNGGAVPRSPNWSVSPDWGLWIMSEGKDGVEPPDDVKRLAEISKLFVQESDEVKRQKLEAEVFDIHAENLWYISSLKQPGDLPQVFYVPVSRRLVNVSDPVAGEWYYAVPESWSIDE